MAKMIQGKNDLETLYPEIAKEWHPTKNGGLLPREIPARSNKKYFWMCKKGHNYDASADHRIRGNGCPFCANKRILIGYNDLKCRFPELVKEWDYEKMKSVLKNMFIVQRLRSIGNVAFVVQVGKPLYVIELEREKRGVQNVLRS